jgi:hypothetical protein
VRPLSAAALVSDPSADTLSLGRKRGSREPPRTMLTDWAVFCFMSKQIAQERHGPSWPPNLVFARVLWRGRKVAVSGPKALSGWLGPP